SRLIVGAGGYCGVQVDGISVEHVSQNHYPLSRGSGSNRHADIIGKIVVLKDRASARDLDAGKDELQEMSCCFNHLTPLADLTYLDRRSPVTRRCDLNGR